MTVHDSLPDTTMRIDNPWLSISPDDYVGHMSCPQVGQYQVLNRLMRDTLESSRPRTILVLGCSVGNGFEHIDPVVTRRVVAVDLNPTYLERLAERHPNPGFGLDLRCTDLAAYSFEPETFDLIHAALVLEYVEWLSLLPRVADALSRGGLLSVVLQLPSRTVPAVTPTGYTSLRALDSVFRFLDPDVLVTQAAALTLHLESRRTESLESGKALEVLRFRKRAV